MVQVVHRSDPPPKRSAFGAQGTVCPVVQKRWPARRPWHAGDVRRHQPLERVHTMAQSGGKNTGFDLKELLSADGDFLRAMMDVAVQAVLEAEMTEVLSAEK